ncbi:MAG: SDR family oxidoreductase [Gammaproteobacteria bacterium]|nr:SDR family oxidoreductase [Gammaproteobacteria bacterium]
MTDMSTASEKGKVAIVTGSATGVGAAVAIMLAQRGCNVVINYSRSRDEAEATAAECRACGVEAIAVRGDVADDADCRGIVAAAIDAWGRLDYLVNNAGKTKFVPFEDLDGLTRDIFLDIYSVNVVGTYQVIRAAAPHLKKTQGAIVNTSSIGGVTGIASSMAYAASKGALNVLTRSLALTLAPEVRVNAVCPGAIQTRWLKSGMGDAQYEGLIDSLSAQLPLRRVATPEGIARSIVAFLVDHTDVTGETLNVDDGLHLGRLPAYSSMDKTRGQL